MKTGDRVYFAARVALAPARHVLVSVVLAGNVAAVDEADVSVRLVGGRLTHVPRGKVCSCEEDAVALLRAGERVGRGDGNNYGGSDGDGDLLGGERHSIPMRKAA